MALSSLVDWLVRRRESCGMLRPAKTDSRSPGAILAAQPAAFTVETSENFFIVPYAFLRDSISNATARI